MNNLKYWKKGIYFGITTDEKFKFLQTYYSDVHSISSGYYTLLSIIKYLCMLILAPIIILSSFLLLIMKIILPIIEKPVIKYIEYFIK